MPITNYTTPEEVRSALSVNSTELPDSEVNLPLVEQRFLGRMYDISTTILDKYEEVKAILEVDRTTAQKKFLAATSLLNTYAVAVDFTPTLATLMTRVLTDGKAEQERFDESVRDTVAGIWSMYELARNRALAWLQVVDSGSTPVMPTPTPLTVFVSTGLSVDPVVGS